MSRCTVCANTRRAEIDKALVEGAPYRRVAARFTVSEGSLYRHARSHLPALMSVGHGAGATAAGDALLRKVDEIERRVKALAAASVESKDYRAAIAAARELIRLLELRARLGGAIKDRALAVNILNVTQEKAQQIINGYLATRRALPAAVETEEQAEDEELE
jgi:hypothetical protein